MARVVLQSVGKRFGAVEAIRDVSVAIRDGEFVALVGPSGCGKSTLLRMIAGLEEVSSGVVAIGDRIVNDMPAKRRDVAMVFQNYALYPHMSVAENMGFSLRLARVPRAEAQGRVRRAAAILGLDALLDRRPAQLSGGQRQRVAMGRAIVRDPAVFLFDEPLSNLDAKLRVQMRAEIKELHQRLGTTMIYVTHDQVEAMTMADRIVVMRDGVIEQVGSPLELYDAPRNAFVAEFIGSPSMNLLPGRTAPGGFRTEGGVLLPAPATGGAALYGVRPEHLSPDPAGAPFEVGVVEPMGSETLLVGRIGGAPVTVVLRERIDARPGAVLGLAPEIGQVHLFDRAGRALAAPPGDVRPAAEVLRR